jgi:hypothetical protein
MEKRAGIEPEVYLTSIQSLWSEYLASSDSSLSMEISSFVENNKPTGIDTEAFQASFTSIMSGECLFLGLESLRLTGQELGIKSRTFLMQPDRELMVVSLSSVPLWHATYTDTQYSEAMAVMTKPVPLTWSRPTVEPPIGHFQSTYQLGKA